MKYLIILAFLTIIPVVFAQSSDSAKNSTNDFWNARSIDSSFKRIDINDFQSAMWHIIYYDSVGYRDGFYIKINRKDTVLSASVQIIEFGQHTSYVYNGTMQGSIDTSAELRLVISTSNEREYIDIKVFDLRGKCVVDSEGNQFMFGDAEYKQKNKYGDFNRSGTWRARIDKR